MKRFLLFSLFTFLSYFSAHAQWNLYTNNFSTGNLRLGTAPFTTKLLYAQASNTDATAVFENTNTSGNGVLISAAYDPLRVGGYNNLNGNYLIVKRNPGNSAYANVGINTSTPDYAYSLDVAGSMRAGGYYTSSDRRLKEDIRPDVQSYQGLYSLKTYEYKYKERQDDRTHFGVMAQEIAEVFPNLVSGSEEKSLSVNYQEMIPLLIRAVQDQKQTIDILQSELGELKAKLSENPEVKGLMQLEDEQMVIYPNPSKTSTKISFSKGQNNATASYIQIVNLNGETVKNINLQGNNSLELNTEDLQKGVYFVRYFTNGELKETKRMLIEK